MSAETRKRWPVEERHQQFVEIALELFGQRTFDEISMDDIAAKAGVTKGLLYRYFKSKRELYLAALLESAAEMFSLTESDPSKSPVDQLLESVEAYLETISEHSDQYLMFIKGGVGFDEQVWKIIEDSHNRYIQRIIQAATDPVSDSPVLRLSLNGWLGFVERTATYWLTDSQLPKFEMRNLLCANLVATLYAAQQVDPEIPLVALALADQL